MVQLRPRENAMRAYLKTFPIAAVDAAVRDFPNGFGQGVFWWEPAAEGGPCKRSLFDEEGNVLLAISVFDRSPP